MFEVTKMKYVAKEASNTKCYRTITIVDEQAKRVYFSYSSCVQYDLKLK